MKIKVILMLSLLFLFSFSFTVRGEDLYNAADIEKIEEALPEDAQEIFENEGWSGETDWNNSLDTSGFISLLKSFFTQGINAPLKASMSVLSLIILSSLIQSFAEKGEISESVDTVCLIGAALLLAVPIYNIIEAVKETLTAAVTFISVAIPVFVGVICASGKPASASATGGIILAACEGLSAVCAFVLLPLMNGCLAVGMCGAFSQEKRVTGLITPIKKGAMWVYSLVSTLFLFLINVKGITGGAADNFSVKTAKFLLGTTVPVAGKALSESASAVAASLNLLKGNVGIYIILGVAAILLPLIFSLICWRVALWGLKYLSELFSTPKIPMLIEAFSGVLSMLLGFTLLQLALFIISLGVMIKL